MAVPQVATHCHFFWLGWDYGSLVHHGESRWQRRLVHPMMVGSRETEGKEKGQEWRTTWNPKTQKLQRWMDTSSRLT